MKSQVSIFYDTLQRYPLMTAFVNKPNDIPKLLEKKKKTSCEGLRKVRNATLDFSCLIKAKSH